MRAVEHHGPGVDLREEGPKATTIGDTDGIARGDAASGVLEILLTGS